MYRLPLQKYTKNIKLKKIPLNIMFCNRFNCICVKELDFHNQKHVNLYNECFKSSGKDKSYHKLWLTI
jgi:hypothetical protein